MEAEKVSHLENPELQRAELEKRVELLLPGNGGRIISYHPFRSMQIIFFDVQTSVPLPDLWQLGLRKGDGGRYLRTLICRRGSCRFTVNGVSNVLQTGQVMMDYSVGDDRQFNFTAESFEGVEITMQVDTLVEESSALRLLRLAIESMGLPEEEIYDADGYIFNYSKTTSDMVKKLMTAGYDCEAGIVILALTIAIGSNLGNDLKALHTGNLNAKQRQIAEDIYHCLTTDFGTKYTAGMFAEKYGASDTTVKKYFRSVYGYGFKEYQIKVRMEWAAEKLIASDMRVGEISDAVGYAMQTKFTKLFKQYYGMTPLEFRRIKRAERAGNAARLAKATKPKKQTETKQKK